MYHALLWMTTSVLTSSVVCAQQKGKQCSAQQENTVPKRSHCKHKPLQLHFPELEAPMRALQSDIHQYRKQHQYSSSKKMIIPDGAVATPTHGCISAPLLLCSALNAFFAALDGNFSYTHHSLPVPSDAWKVSIIYYLSSFISLLNTSQGLWVWVFFLIHFQIFKPHFLTQNRE